MKVLFLGSSHFSKLVLEKMLENGINVVSVVTQPDKPSGRGHRLMPTEVKTYALSEGIEVKTFDKIRLHMQEVKEIDYDISVVASFGQILPNEFLEHRLCINVHPSLLPEYRGATPIQNAILNGDDKTGVTIMKVAKEVDAGDIILQREIGLNGEYYLELEEKLATIGGEMVCDVLSEYANNTITFTPQEHEKATKVEKINKEDGNLDFSKSANEIINRVRALSEEVGTQFCVGDLIIKVERAENVSGEFDCPPMVILNNKKRFIVGCKGGAIEITRCKSPSGKSVTGRDFLNGHQNLLNKRVDNAE